MQLKVMYIDDEEDLCEVFNDFLSGRGYHVRTFSNPSMGVEEILKNPPDILFIDYRLPSTTGDEIALKLNSSIPKFLVTGDLKIQPKYPFVEIIKKPFKREKLLEILTKYSS